MAKTSSPPRIFVQIVSYRDSECHWTIKDLFETASNPDRIFVGLCWQFDPEKDQDCFLVKYPRPGQVRRVDFHVRDAQGAGWARNQAQALYQGEEYILQIQAHMRFVPGWDDMLIDMLARCPSKKPLLSAYLPPYMPPRELQDYPGAMLRVRIRRIGPPEDPQIVHLTASTVSREDTERCGLYPSPFWIGNFMFCRPELLEEVPNDPYIYFYGEELAYSARLFTHGWDIFQVSETVIYHQWDRRESLKKQPYRRPVDDRNQRSLERVRHMLGFAPTEDREALTELDRYGLGTERPLAPAGNAVGIRRDRLGVAHDVERR
jgi:hypothetical protein